MGAVGAALAAAATDDMMNWWGPRVSQLDTVNLPQISKREHRGSYKEDYPRVSRGAD